MKKSTIRRYEAQTTSQMTAANLNKVAGKQDARRVMSMDTDTAADIALRSIIDGDVA